MQPLEPADTPVPVVPQDLPEGVVPMPFFEFLQRVIREAPEPLISNMDDQDIREFMQIMRMVWAFRGQLPPLPTREQLEDNVD